MIRTNDHDYLENVIGMPEAHAAAFMQVAESEECVIMVRATGPTCHGLLEEGYDTKGYRIHGKSCDWGPMAGFVLRDPRLNKSGLAKEVFNRRKHEEAIIHDAEGQGWHASTTPVQISLNRIKWLKANNLIVAHYRGRRFEGIAKRGEEMQFAYALIPVAADLFGLYFDNHGPAHTQWMQERGAGVEPQYYSVLGRTWTKLEAMLAMTNPVGHRKFPREHYLNAITGDYDLFAVWPFVGGDKGYDASAYGLDHRPLGTVRGAEGDGADNIDRLERDFTARRDMEPPGTLGQGTKLGNITPRMYMICQLINSIVGTQVLWHSDEAARPHLDDMDLPLIAFNPNGNYMSIETVEDMKTFISFCDASGIRVSLSNAWTMVPTAEKPKRLGPDYNRFIPADGTRIIVPRWYNS